MLNDDLAVRPIEQPPRLGVGLALGVEQGEGGAEVVGRHFWQVPGVVWSPVLGVQRTPPRASDANVTPGGVNTGQRRPSGDFAGGQESTTASPMSRAAQTVARFSA